MSDPPNPELTSEELAEFRAFLAERKVREERTASASAAGRPDPTDVARAGKASASHDDVAYIRGGAGMAVDSGRALRVFIVFCLLILATLVILLTISAFHQNSRLSRLQHHGVAVDVTVTGCVGLASGTGVTQYAFTCRGNFILDGRAYNEVIGGTTAIQEPGAVLHALTIPGDPTLLTVTTAVVHRHASHTVFITPVILFVVLIFGLLLFVWLYRRSRRPEGAAGVTTQRS